MNATPLVSIILPTYNGARYLAQSIHSCLEQTYIHWELIIVDDASTDNTPEIIAGFVVQDRRIRSIRHPANRKLPGALNTGFAAAQGELLTWTSDDNAFRPHALETLVTFLTDKPQIDLVYTDYSIIEDGIETQPVRVKNPENLIYGSTVGPSFMYRRAIYESVGDYDTQSFLSEDYNYWLRVSRRFTLRPLHENLYLYRIHKKSLTAENNRERFRIKYEVMKRNIPYLEWLKQDRALQAKAYLKLAEDALEFGSREESFRFGLKAFLASPLTAGYGLYRRRKQNAADRQPASHRNKEIAESK